MWVLNFGPPNRPPFARQKGSVFSGGPRDRYDWKTMREIRGLNLRYWLYVRGFCLANAKFQHFGFLGSHLFGLFGFCCGISCFKGRRCWRGGASLIFGTRVSCWKLVTIVSKLGYNLFRGRIQPTYIGVIIQLLSTMDIPVWFLILPFGSPIKGCMLEGRAPAW